MKDMLEATAPGYKSPLGLTQECFGRLVFDSSAPVEWPTYYNGDATFLFFRAFSEKIVDRGDEMTFGDTKIAVMGPADTEMLKAVLGSTPAAVIKRLQGDIAETRQYIAEMKKGKFSQEVGRAIENGEEQIASWSNTVKERQAGFENFDPGLPNSEGYWRTKSVANDESERYSVFRAYLLRDGKIYAFESQQKLMKASDKEAHKQKFVRLLKTFRVRKPNEIPTELGVCIPHGFIPDDGKTLSEFKQSMRFADAPGVVYTLETGNVHPRRMKSTATMAATKANVGKPGSGGEEYAVKDFVTQRIGPRSYKIGGLTGEQGGVALTVKKSGKEAYEAYSVYTGYSGWLGTAVLPYITVDMHTYTKEQAPELKQNPPPFKQSMERLDLLLKSMRLRPTNPPMPDFANQSR